MATPFRSGGGYGRPASGSGGSRREATGDAYSEVAPMSEELSGDGAYRSAAGAAFDGPAAWADVDQEEVCWSSHRTHLLKRPRCASCLPSCGYLNNSKVP